YRGMIFLPVMTTTCRGHPTALHPTVVRSCWGRGANTVGVVSEWGLPMAITARRVVVVVVCVAFFGCRDRGPDEGRPRVAEDDPRTLFPPPFRTTTGSFNQNGTAFDRAEINLGGVGVVWVPEGAGQSEVAVAQGDKTDRVVVDLEKQWFD